MFDTTTTAGAANLAGVWGMAVSRAAGKISFYWGTACNATTGAGGGEVWRLDPHPTGPANGQPVGSTYTRLATGLGATAPDRGSASRPP